MSKVSVLISRVYMTALLWVDERPLREKLHRELEELSSRVQNLESSVDEYFSKDLVQYQAWVNFRFADDLAQINELEKSVRILGRHVEESEQLSLQSLTNPRDLFEALYGGESEEQILQKIFAQHEQEERAEKLEEEICVEGQTKISAGRDAREIFRKIAKHLHPDVRGTELSDFEKNVWIKAQRAYSKNDTFELQRLECALRTSDDSASEALSYSELCRQGADFQKKCESLETEVKILTGERAWQFSKRKTLSGLEREIQSEFKNTIKSLRTQETHFRRTLSSWLTPTTKPTPRRPRSQKSQTSLF
jgi:hypothetical protein